MDNIQGVGARTVQIKSNLRNLL